MTHLADTARDRFGIARLHPWQLEAMQALVEGCGLALVVAPTGGGKSLCYQLPAAVLGGTSVVVSPLIALMDDQVRSLQERGIEATYLASTLAPDERHQREMDLKRGRYQLLYLAPERLRSGATLNLLSHLEPPLVAIDEAHCISQWGHDFRPDYLRLGEVLAELRPERVLACTATATPLVRSEILERLGMPRESTKVVLRGFARPNLHLRVEEIDRAATRRVEAERALLSALGNPNQPRGAAIVYAGTRKASQQFADHLTDRGWRCRAYHAGLEARERERVSELFAQRELDVVVATNAFGMGIDRPDIRAVVHLRAPGSIEAYYQEVGRAGRDGDPATGLLLSGSPDYGFRRRLIDQSSSADGTPLSAQLRERQWQLFLDLMRYVEAGSCRHDFILRYFDDEQEALGGCGHCDVCEQLAGGAISSADEEERTLAVRKALAGVARLRGRAGLTALSQSLHGADTQRIRQLGLTELSTHGILSDRSPEWVMALLRRLMTAGLVDLTPDQYPVPFLTPDGRAVMRGERKAEVILPAARKPRAAKGRKTAAAEDDADYDAELYDRLRAIRRDIAREHSVAAFVVCHDRTLREMARARPQNAFELGQVHGMGPVKVDAYGDHFLAALRRD